MDEIILIGALKTSGKCIKIDSELESEVTFTCPAIEIANIARLVMVSGKRLVITVRVEG